MNKITTAAIAAIAVAALAVAGTAAAQNGQRFSDVPLNHYASDAVEWAVAQGITAGCGDGTKFCPERTLNRAQMVTFLHRYHMRNPHRTTVGPVENGAGCEAEVVVTVVGQQPSKAFDLNENVHYWQVTTTTPGLESGNALIQFRDGGMWDTDHGFPWRTWNADSGRFPADPARAGFPRRVVFDSGHDRTWTVRLTAVSLTDGGICADDN